MKKSIFLIFVSIMIFLGGSVRVEAGELKCSEGKNGCSDETIVSMLNEKIESTGGSYQLLCVYKVNFKKNVYYNYIIYNQNFQEDVEYSNKFYAGTTIGSVDSSDIGMALRNTTGYGVSAFVLDDEAYGRLQNNYECPLYSYIDDNSTNEVCFDSDGTSCFNDGKKINSGTKFDEDENNGSTLINSFTAEAEENANIVNVNFSTVCNQIPSEYDGVCRYQQTTSGDLAVLYYNSSKTTLVDLIVSGRNYQQYKLDYNVKFYPVSGYDNIYYLNSISGIDSCPSLLYLHTKEVTDINRTITLNGQLRYWAMQNDISSIVPNTNSVQYTLVACDNSVVITDPTRDPKCDDIFDDEFISLFNKIMLYIRIGIPILLIVLITLDVVSAIFAPDDKAVATARGKIIKRLIIAVIIFFVPTLINLIFNIVNDVWTDANYEICGLDSN